MSEHIFIDPWLQRMKRTVSLPRDLVFICAYDLDVGIDFITEAAFIRRRSQRDELWVLRELPASSISAIANGLAYPFAVRPNGPVSFGCAVSAPRKVGQLQTCLSLLENLVCSRVGYGWPSGFVAPGTVDQSEFNNLLELIESELRENTERARQSETAIIVTAKELRLCPEPLGIGTNSWRARCPETNHPLFINAEAGSFGCGWCKRKGGAVELRKFARQRE